MKNLYFVTFHPTNTQFVVEQDNEEKALESAIECNFCRSRSRNIF